MHFQHAGQRMDMIGIFICKPVEPMPPRHTAQLPTPLPASLLCLRRSNKIRPKPVKPVHAGPRTSHRPPSGPRCRPRHLRHTIQKATGPAYHSPDHSADLHTDLKTLRLSRGPYTPDILLHSPLSSRCLARMPATTPHPGSEPQIGWLGGLG